MIYTAEQIIDRVTKAVRTDVWVMTNGILTYEGDSTFRFDTFGSNATMLKTALGSGFDRIVEVEGEEFEMNCLCRFDGNWLTVYVDFF